MKCRRTHFVFDLIGHTCRIVVRSVGCLAQDDDNNGACVLNRFPGRLPCFAGLEFGGSDMSTCPRCFGSVWGGLGFAAFAWLSEEVCLRQN